MTYVVTFELTVGDRRRWTETLKDFSAAVVVKHLEKRGIGLGQANNEPFAPECDDDGVITATICRNGTEKIGRFIAKPVAVDEGDGAPSPVIDNLSDSVLCEETFA